MKKIMFLVILIIFSPIAIAETEIFKGKVITDTDKLIDQKIFRFSYDERSDKIFAQTHTTSLIVENGQCKSNAAFRVCINSANFSHKNITTYQYYYHLDVIIYKLTGSLSTTSEVTSKTLLQNEPTELKITITNPTDFEITNIVFNQDLTPFIIKEAKVCATDGNQIKWQGSLKSRYDVACTATISAEKEGMYNLAGNLTYFNGFENEKRITNFTITILPKQLKLSQIIDKNIEVKQPFYINMSLQNIHKTEKIEASLSIEVTNNMILFKEPPGFVKEANVLKRSLVFEPSSMLNYSLYLEALSEGNNLIKHSIEYTIKNIRDVLENTTFINSTEPKPILNFSTEYAEVTAGQKFIVIAKIKNPSRVHNLNDIKASLNVPYNNKLEQGADKLKPNETYTIISNTFVIPNDADLGLESGNKTSKLNLSVEYKFNEAIKSLNNSLEIVIKPGSSNETKVISKENKAIEKPQAVTIAEKVKSKLFKKEILFFIVIILLAFLVIFFIIFKRKKGKVENMPLQENI